MKKFLLTLVALFCVATTVSAKGGNFFTNHDWSAGLRVGYGVQAQAECFLNKSNYLEARLGLFGGLNAEFTALYNWHLFDWNWTPKVGSWYFDAGVGANLGGGVGYVYGGVAGQAKFGIKFNKVPIRLAVDYTPTLGVGGAYGKYKGDSGNVGLYALGFANIGLSATYCF